MIKRILAIILIGGIAMSFIGVNNGNGWVDYPSTATLVNAQNLNIDEDGIKEAHLLLAEKAPQSAVDSEIANRQAADSALQSQINTITTQADNYYVKCLSTDTGALLVVASGATTGQINLASVTPHMSDYTPAAGDYVTKAYNTLNAETKNIRTAFDGTVYPSAGESVRGQASKLSTQITESTYGKYINRFNSSTLTAGYVLDYRTGLPTVAVAGWATTDYIAAEQYDKVYLAYTNGADLCAVCLFDINHNFLGYVYGNVKRAAYEFYIMTANVAYIRYNVFPTSLLAYDKQYVKIEKYAYLRENLNTLKAAMDGSANIIYYVGAGRTGANTFTTLKACTEYINDNNIQNATVYVDAGDYNIVTEFGSTYLDSISTTTNQGFGLFVGNNTHFIFSAGARVLFNYTGTNEDCAEFFSPFNVTGSVTLENAVIEVSNCRYCVHEDLPTTSEAIPDQYTVKYINCIMEHKGNTIGTYTGTVCVGAGTYKNSLSVIDGGRYTCTSAFPYAISYHNATTTYPSRLIFKNVWVNNAIRLADFGTGNYVDVTITGCYLPNGHTTGNYFNITEWGNTSN